MTPWQKAEFQLEEKFEQLVDIVTSGENKDAEEVGACITTMIALCQDVDKMFSLEHKEKFWSTIEEDIKELLILTDSFLVGK